MRGGKGRAARCRPSTVSSSVSGSRAPMSSSSRTAFVTATSMGGSTALPRKLATFSPGPARPISNSLACTLHQQCQMAPGQQLQPAVQAGPFRSPTATLMSHGLSHGTGQLLQPAVQAGPFRSPTAAIIWACVAPSLEGKILRAPTNQATLTSTIRLQLGLSSPSFGDYHLACHNSGIGVCVTGLGLFQDV